LAEKVKDAANPERMEQKGDFLRRCFEQGNVPYVTPHGCPTDVITVIEYLTGPNHISDLAYYIPVGYSSTEGGLDSYCTPSPMPVVPKRGDWQFYGTVDWVRVQTPYDDNVRNSWTTLNARADVFWNESDELSQIAARAFGFGKTASGGAVTGIPDVNSIPESLRETYVRHAIMGAVSNPISAASTNPATVKNYAIILDQASNAFGIGKEKDAE